MTELLHELSHAFTGSYWLGVLIAFAAGILTVFTPCSLTNIPLIVSYIGGTTKKKAAVFSVFICLGQSAVFVLMGLLAASLGKLMSLAGFDKIWHSVLAAIMLFMASEMFGITNVLHRHGHATDGVKQKGILGALLIGMLGAVFATPCSLPILSAILAYVSTTGFPIYAGGVMMLAYGVGHSVPLVLAGSSINFVSKIGSSEKYAKAAKIIKFIFGVLLVLLAVYLVVSAFFLEH
jgi:cytochrome c biogenesis protein CcdA